MKIPYGSVASHINNELQNEYGLKYDVRSIKRQIRYNDSTSITDEGIDSTFFFLDGEGNEMSINVFYNTNTKQFNVLSYGDISEIKSILFGN